MLAERLDLMVATYSSCRGTGERSIQTTFTGRACCAGGFASVRVHPELLIKMSPTKTIDGTLISFLISATLSPHLLKYKDDLPFYMDSKPTLAVAEVGCSNFQGIDFRNQTQNLLSKLGNIISIGRGPVCVRALENCNHLRL